MTATVNFILMKKKWFKKQETSIKLTVSKEDVTGEKPHTT